jgi:hypothetical protein
MWALFYGPLTNNFICYSFESTYMNAFGYVWFLSFICTVLSIRIVIFVYIPMSRYQRGNADIIIRLPDTPPVKYEMQMSWVKYEA